MNRAPLGLAVGAVLLAIVGLVLGQNARNEIADVKAAIPPANPALDKLPAQLDALAAEVRALRKERQDDAERLAGLERELAAARTSLAQQAAAIESLRSAGAAVVAVEPAPARDTTREAAEKAAAKAEFDELRRKVFAGEATDEEQQRFWELAHTSGVLAEIISELAAKVEQVPADVSARMQLAQAYLARLLSVPDGPERGSWAMKAEQQWAAVLEIDKDHWEARYSRAISWSYWPEQFNKAPDAIREFETLRAQQQRMTPEPEQANVYVTLAMLYRRVGNADKARQALEEGLVRHPGHDGLRKALEVGGR